MGGRYYRHSDKQKIAEAFHATYGGVTVQPRSHGPDNPDRHQTSNGKFGICLQTTTRPAKLPLADGEGLYTRGGVVQPFDLGKMRNWEVVVRSYSNDDGDLLSASLLL